MTNPYANIEYVMANVVPIQNSIMSNINRGDLTAMYDAGIPTPISATVQRRNLQRARCSEDLLPPMTSARTCPNTSLDPLRMNECEGYWRDHPPRPEGLLPPLRQPDGYWPPLTLCDPHDGPHHGRLPHPGMPGRDEPDRVGRGRVVQDAQSGVLP
ncbi:hypothetical protein HO133_010308 [Letharia lupina]|uniref:Uncharacterized protein n=1 Tax=Letharia lupina TaxID=560253 RepID=A0A8H6FE38_9LECA|nr:uncharacterized protein HO133_010308 [Letharia lupina]KAF6225112.1 hypothetical protein HO133_010308 [Letharia lupina]